MYFVAEKQYERKTVALNKIKISGMKIFSVVEILENKKKYAIRAGHVVHRILTNGTNTKLLRSVYRLLSNLYKSLRSFVLVIWMQCQCPVCDCDLLL